MLMYVAQHAPPVFILNCDISAGTIQNIFRKFRFENDQSKPVTCNSITLQLRRIDFAHCDVHKLVVKQMPVARTSTPLKMRYKFFCHHIHVIAAHNFATGRIQKRAQNSIGIHRALEDKHMHGATYRILSSVYKVGNLSSLVSCLAQSWNSNIECMRVFTWKLFCNDKGCMLNTSFDVVGTGTCCVVAMRYLDIYCIKHMKQIIFCCMFDSQCTIYHERTQPQRHVPVQGPGGCLR